MGLGALVIFGPLQLGNKRRTIRLERRKDFIDGFENLRIREFENWGI
jgi:hypothetical protein